MLNLRTFLLIGASILVLVTKSQLAGVELAFGVVALTVWILLPSPDSALPDPEISAGDLPDGASGFRINVRRPPVTEAQKKSYTRLAQANNAASTLATLGLLFSFVSGVIALIF